MNKLSDCWETPSELFNELNDEFNFDIDLCATRGNTKCMLWCDDYLKGTVGSPDGDCLSLYTLIDYSEVHVAFMNPPYSNPKPFIEKAWEDSKYCKIVCLVKCDPSTRWWATFWDYDTHKPKSGCEVRYFTKRIKFSAPKSLGLTEQVSGGYLVDCEDFRAVSPNNARVARGPCGGGFMCEV